MGCCGAKIAPRGMGVSIQCPDGERWATPDAISPAPLIRTINSFSLTDSMRFSLMQSEPDGVSPLGRCDGVRQPPPATNQRLSVAIKYPIPSRASGCRVKMNVAYNTLFCKWRPFDDGWRRQPFPIVVKTVWV